MRRPLPEDSGEFRRLSRRRRSFRFLETHERSRSRSNERNSSHSSPGERRNNDQLRHNCTNHLNVPKRPVHSVMKSVYDLPEVKAGLRNVCFIADTLRDQDKEERVRKAISTC